MMDNNEKIARLSKMGVIEQDGTLTPVSKSGLAAAQRALNANHSLDLHSLLCVAIEAQDALVPARI